VGKVHGLVLGHGRKEDEKVKEGVDLSKKVKVCPPGVRVEKDRRKFNFRDLEK
jgi:hypothetical protein